MTCLIQIYVHIKNTEKYIQGETLLKKNFAKLKNAYICGNKLHKRLQMQRK